MTATAQSMSPDTAALFDRYVIPNYGRYPVSLVRGEGSWVWDDQGNKYLDFFPGWGCNLLGHCPPAVVRASSWPAPCAAIKACTDAVGTLACGFLDLTTSTLDLVCL